MQKNFPTTSATVHVFSLSYYYYLLNIPLPHFLSQKDNFTYLFSTVITIQIKNRFLKNDIELLPVL